MARRTKFKSNKAEIASKIRGGREKALEAAGRALSTEVKRVLLRGSRSGREYNVPGTKTTYTASAPGEPPAPRTGDLANSYTFSVSSPRVIVGSPKPQAQLEYGWGHAAPRPHLRPAERNARPVLAKLMITKATEDL